MSHILNTLYNKYSPDNGNCRIHHNTVVMHQTLSRTFAESEVRNNTLQQHRPNANEVFIIFKKGVVLGSETSCCQHCPA